MRPLIILRVLFFSLRLKCVTSLLFVQKPNLTSLKMLKTGGKCYNKFALMTIDVRMSKPRENFYEFIRVKLWTIAGKQNLNGGRAVLPRVLYIRIKGGDIRRVT